MQYNRNIPRSSADDDSFGYNNDNNQKGEALNSGNARIIFAKSASTGLVSFADGKVLVKSFGFLDKIGYAFITIGSFVVLVILKNKENETPIGGLLIGILLFILGFIIVKVVKTYSVIDYRAKAIYTETLFNNKVTLWKSGTTYINNITEISIDNRPVETSAQNMGMGSQTYLISGKNKVRGTVAKCDSAIAALLKNGKIYYITDFTNNINIREAYKLFSSELAKAYNINYKTNFDDYKLVVKKKGPKYYLDIENYKKVTSDSVLMSIARIIFGVMFILGAIVLMFYLIYKFV